MMSDNPQVDAVTAKLESGARGERIAELEQLVRDMYAAMRRLDVFLAVHGFDMPSKEFEQRVKSLGIEAEE